MHQSIMVRPTADAVEPCLKHAKLAIAKLRVEFFQQEYRRYFLFQHRAGKKIVSHLDQKIEIILPQDFSPKPSDRPAQITGIPSMRLNLVFEETLSPGGVLVGADTSERSPQLCSDIPRACLLLCHRSVP